MIVIAIGANLPGAAGSPRENCEAALRALEAAGVTIARRSRWYRSPPWPPSDQPWYVNGVALVRTQQGPAELLATLHAIEARFGRVRSKGTVNAARPLDLDLIDYDGLVREAAPPILPHPRLEARAFVLRPLAEIAPDWRHPKSGRSVKDLADALPPDAVADPLPQGPDRA
ncbi:MAG TPA: 2-amino-4-hydroxy-6-hydroxymethyldihydropteridine diphosphokinase [Alphaproteobacteria bacterium]|nr:2-amino-4-hydroxy-6-hydroxymethyldihydropteridine diphosphokinase [Alphaproteobacteria bacterium]